MADRSGIRARSRRGAIGETWWSARWVRVLESFGMGSRLQRGRAYARQGQVLDIDVQPGVVTARVQGSRPRPYRVEIRLTPLTDRQWEAVARVMARQAAFAALLLAGEMPRNIEDAFREAKVSLFPASRAELATSCSCPDWANPCKHVAAVHYLLAEAFDRDPFMIFTLRGRTKEQIIAQLRTLRSSEASAGAAPGAGVEAKAEALTPPSSGDPLLQMLREALADVQAPPLESCLHRFWESGPAATGSGPQEGGGDVGPARLARPPSPPAVDGAVLRLLGPAPVEAGERNLAEVLQGLYPLVTRFAIEEAMNEAVDHGHDGEATM